MRKRRRRKNPYIDMFGVNNGESPEIDFKPIVDAILGAFPPRTVVTNIPPEMYKKMISLCHPDKHNNSEVSQEVTRWLIQERAKIQ